MPKKHKLKIKMADVALIIVVSVLVAMAFWVSFVPNISPDPVAGQLVNWGTNPGLGMFLGFAASGLVIVYFVGIRKEV